MSRMWKRNKKIVENKNEEDNTEAEAIIIEEVIIRLKYIICIGDFL